MGESFSGWQDLGRALFGGRADNVRAYQQGAQGAAQLERMLSEARIKRSEALARDRMQQALVDNGANPQEAALLSTVFAAGYNPEQLSGYQLDRQKYGVGDEAATAARGGNVDLMNNLLSVFKGEPRERTKIDSGIAFDPYMPAATQALRTTPVADANIAAINALAGQREAAATAAGAQADLRNRTDPNLRVGSGGKGQPPVLLQGQPPATYVPQPGEVSLESVLRGEGLPPEIIAQIGRAAESGQDFAVTVPPTRPPMRPGAGAQVTTSPKPAKPAAPASGPKKRFTEADALQALADAREAVRRGLVTKEEAKRRLRAAGMPRTAELIR